VEALKPSDASPNATRGTLADTIPFIFPEERVMEQKNFIAAIVLSIAFLFIWSVFVVPRFSPTPLPTPPAAGAPATAVAEKPATLGTAPGREPMTTANAVDQILRDATNEIVFAPQGGSVRHWRLKLKGHEVDLVLNPQAPRLPLASFPEAVYQIRQAGNRVEMKTVLPGGVRLTKTLTLAPTGFLHALDIRFENPGAQAATLDSWSLVWGPGLGTAPEEQKENNRLIRPLAMNKLNANVLKDGEHPLIGNWAGIDNRYFLVAFLPPADPKPSLQVSGKHETTALTLRQPVQVPARGSVNLHYGLYAGPKGYTQLKTYGQHLEESVDFGWFSAVGKLILNVLYRLEKWTQNYGWAIIILTIALQILLLPLTLKSLRAQLAMKQMQPQIAALQARFKGDPKRLNIEMMNLYKKSGTNPFGGCLPMLLQIPIFWALFTTLRNAYELRGAPFALWIHDLAAPDKLPFAPYIHILPVIMGAGMFFQQRLTGAVTDPTQRQMMIIMPIMFTFMFYGFPSGLVLYWLTQSLCTMLFQWLYIRSQAKPSAVVDTSIVK
jgi:YidC/Oxa1 family membrane protein insertase